MLDMGSRCSLILSPLLFPKGVVDALNLIPQRNRADYDEELTVKQDDNDQKFVCYYSVKITFIIYYSGYMFYFEMIGNSH